MEKKWNKKLIDWRLKLKRRQWYTLHIKREKRREKNQTITSDNSTIVNCHVSL